MIAKSLILLAVAVSSLAVVDAMPQRARGTAPADARVPFQVGESLTYDASWSNFVTAAQVTMRVVNRQPLNAGRSGYTLQVEAQSVPLAARLYRIYYKIESVLDTASLVPTRSATYSNERGRERVKSLSFGPANMADVEIRRDDVFRTKIALPPRTLDTLSAMYVLRALAAKPGDVVTIPIVDGEEVMKLRLAFGGRETVTTGAGKVPGWRVTPTIFDASGKPTATGKFTFWLSDDPSRRPLRFEADLAVGAITLTLRGH